VDVTLAVVIVSVVVVCFVIGLLFPRLSRKEQRKRDRALFKREVKGAGRAGKLGGLLARALKLVRTAGDKAAESGRATHRKLPH
jgi:hypothetical protein